MIRLKLEYGSIDLPADLKIPFEFNNSGLGTDLIQGPKSYTFAVPETDNNNIVLRFSRFVETTTKGRIYNAELDVHGIILIGTFYTDSYENRQYNCAFFPNGFNTLAIEKKLSEIDFGPDVVMGNYPQDVLNYMKTESQKLWPNTTVAFPMIFNPKFYQDDPTDIQGAQPEFQGIINAYDTVTQEYLRNIGQTSYPPSISDNFYAIVPYFYAKFVAKKIFESLGYSIKGNWYDDPETHRILVHCNKALDKVHSNYMRAGIDQQYFAWPFNNGPIGGSVFFDLPIIDDYTLPNQDYDNEFNINGTLEFEPSFDCQVLISAHLHFDNYNHSGDLMRLYIVDELDLPMLFSSPLAVTTGTLTINSVPFTLLYGKKYRLAVGCDSAISLFTPIPHVMDILDSWMEIIIYAPVNVNTFTKSYNPANCLPDIKISDFLNALKNKENLRFDYDIINKEVHLNYNESVIRKNKAVDITAKAALNYRQEIKPRRRFALKFDWQNDRTADNNLVYQYDRPRYGDYDSIFLAPLATTLPIGTEIYIRNENKFYRVADSTVSPGTNTYVPTYDLFPDVTFGTDGELEDINMGWSPFATKRLAGLFNTKIIPAIDELGSSESYSNGLNECSIKFLFFWNFQPDSNGDLYPMASSINRDVGGSILGNTTDILDFPINGIIQRRYNLWLQMLSQAEEYRRFLDMELDILSLSFDQLYAISHQWYIIKQFRFNATHEGIEAAETTMLHLP